VVYGLCNEFMILNSWTHKLNPLKKIVIFNFVWYSWKQFVFPKKKKLYILICKCLNLIRILKLLNLVRGLKKVYVSYRLDDLIRNNLVIIEVSWFRFYKFYEFLIQSKSMNFGFDRVTCLKKKKLQSICKLL